MNHVMLQKFRNQRIFKNFRLYSWFNYFYWTTFTKYLHIQITEHSGDTKIPHRTKYTTGYILVSRFLFNLLCPFPILFTSYCSLFKHFTTHPVKPQISGNFTTKTNKYALGKCKSWPTNEWPMTTHRSQEENVDVV